MPRPRMKRIWVFEEDARLFKSEAALRGKKSWELFKEKVRVDMDKDIKEVKRFDFRL